MIRLELADIQGNIHRAYGRYGFPFCRHLFFNIADADAGRRFVDAVRPKVTTAEPWDTVETTGGTVVAKPPVAINVGFTFLGLLALDLPTRTLRLMPDEFIDGMGCRAAILGDVGPSDPEHWDAIWRFDPHDRPHQVHVWVSLNVGAGPDGRPLPVLNACTDWLRSLTSQDGVRLLAGHGETGDGLWQDSEALMDRVGDAMVPVPREHFGFTDGISDPAFDGQFDAAMQAVDVRGGGKITGVDRGGARQWSALEAGEFILGQVDEGQEFPVATQPANFARNGTFMVWRKLRQDVGAFEAEMARLAALWRAVTGCGEDEAAETVRAKIVGRWRSGIPLAVAPTHAEERRLAAAWADCFHPDRRRPDQRRRVDPQRLAAFSSMLTGFDFGGDTAGAACPLGAHIRRANPRDMLDPAVGPGSGASTLTNRRRILRRGLPYSDPGGEKGVVFMAMCSSLFRQFEFIQQQWMNYGLDFEAGNDGCPLIGTRAVPTKHVVQHGAANDRPVIFADLPDFVATRGGDYFFLPGLDGLRMIAMGTVEPS